MIKSSEDFERTVGLQFPQVLRGDERRGVDIGQVNDIDATGPALAHQGEGIIDITYENPHPGRRTKHSIPMRIGL